eukprot:TRINITY_DN4151_c0_g2_i1.p1 TRINITY_DN4151_c0_g2~~TRINITY_DN4151_c0_g2_i1.p1  ORF type:complete len:287 (+),score=100.14 TRINITY_DN4151_c0_g2_i1:58-918(+)
MRSALCLLALAAAGSAGAGCGGDALRAVGGIGRSTAAAVTACVDGGAGCQAAVGGLESTVKGAREEALVAAQHGCAGACAAGLLEVVAAVEPLGGAVKTAEAVCPSGNVTSSACLLGLMGVLVDVNGVVTSSLRAATACGVNASWLIAAEETCLPAVLVSASGLKQSVDGVRNAVSSCGAKGAGCVADISAAGSSLTEVASDAAAAARACGHDASPLAACIQDITDGVAALRTAVNSLSEVKATCTTGASVFDYARCTKDVALVGADVARVAAMMAKAYTTTCTGL